MLLSSFPNKGNLKIYDVRSHINVNSLIPLIHRKGLLYKDPSIKRAIDIYLSLAGDDHVVVQACLQTSCFDKMRSWEKRASKIGILVVSMDNAAGRRDEFMDDKGHVLSKQLSPANLAVFDNSIIYHRLTEIQSVDVKEDCHRGFLLFSNTETIPGIVPIPL